MKASEHQQYNDSLKFGKEFEEILQWMFGGIEVIPSGLAFSEAAFQHRHKCQHCFKVFSHAGPEEGSGSYEERHLCPSQGCRKPCTTWIYDPFQDGPEGQPYPAHSRVFGPDKP